MQNRKFSLNVICGLKITGARLIVDDIGLQFENNAALSIYNTSRLTGITYGEEGILIGKKVLNISANDYVITIEIEDNITISIDMRDEAYNGPEAIVLGVPGQPIVVWN